MPRYDYKCEDGHVTEHKFAFGEAPDDIICGVEAEVGMPDCDIGCCTESCTESAKRQFASPTIYVNHVMLPKSKRMKRMGAG